MKHLNCIAASLYQDGKQLFRVQKQLSVQLHISVMIKK